MVTNERLRELLELFDGTKEIGEIHSAFVELIASREVIDKAERFAVDNFEGWEGYIKARDDLLSAIQKLKGA